MKKVILQEKSSRVYLKDLSQKDIIGMQNGCGIKYILLQTIKGYEYISDENILSGSRIQYTNLYAALENCHSLFVFDTSKELFKWMSE